MEVRVLYESVPGKWQSRPAGAHQSGRLIKAGCNDVPVDRFGQACRFLASFRLPFALHGYANEETAHEAPRLASAEV